MCACSSPSTATIPTPEGIRFKVEDMTCAHCAGVIRNAMREALPGVEFAIDIESQTVTVARDAARAESAIRDAGYEPVLIAA